MLILFEKVNSKSMEFIFNTGRVGLCSPHFDCVPEAKSLNLSYFNSKIESIIIFSLVVRLNEMTCV